MSMERESECQRALLLLSRHFRGGPEIDKELEWRHAIGDEYEVGYRKPPKHTRFKKGKSGNPKGRPKRRMPDFVKVLAEALAEKVEVRVNGKTVVYTYEELIVERLGEMSAKGDKRAVRRLIALREHTEQEGELEPPVFRPDRGERAVLRELP